MYALKKHWFCANSVDSVARRPVDAVGMLTARVVLGRRQRSAGDQPGEVD